MPGGIATQEADRSPARVFTETLRALPWKWTAAHDVELLEGPPFRRAFVVHGPRGPDSNRHLAVDSRALYQLNYLGAVPLGLRVNEDRRKMALSGASAETSDAPERANDLRREGRFPRNESRRTIPVRSTALCIRFAPALRHSERPRRCTPAARPRCRLSGHAPTRAAARLRRSSSAAPATFTADETRNPCLRGARRRIPWSPRCDLTPPGPARAAAPAARR